MKYRDGKYSPDIGDQVEVYSDDFEPELARVLSIGKVKIKIRYENEYIKPRSEWVLPTNCDLIAREG